jgi:hypothetical protein
MEVMGRSDAITDSAPRFRAKPLMRMGGYMWLVGIPLLVWTSPADDRAWLWFFFACGYAWAWHCWPRTIRFTQDGLEQRNKFGWMKRIQYDDVVAISRLPVYGKGGLIGHDLVVMGSDHEIIYSDYFHADPYGFIQAIQARTGKKLQSPIA